MANCNSTDFLNKTSICSIIVDGECNQSLTLPETMLYIAAIQLVSDAGCPSFH